MEKMDTSSAFMTPTKTPTKRGRDEDISLDDEAGGGSASSTASPGAPLFPKGAAGLKTRHKTTIPFTKKFYFKIYANDWNWTPADKSLVGFMTVIPWHALCMYLSPDEYLEIIRSCGYAKISETGIECKLKSVRTPFDANSQDVAEANGNLEFEFKRWDGLEQMMPFDVVDVAQDGTQKYWKTRGELIQRLYGVSDFNGTSIDQASMRKKLPATMRERGLSWRPKWRFNNTNQNANGYMAVNNNHYVSSLPIGEYETDSINTMVCKTSEGYCFNKIYRPKNGIISAAASLGVGTTTIGLTRINQKTRMREVVVDPTNVNNQYESLFGGTSGGGAQTLTVTKQSGYTTNFQNTLTTGGVETPGLFAPTYRGDGTDYNIQSPSLTSGTPAFSSVWKDGPASTTNIGVAKAVTDVVINPPSAKAINDPKDGFGFGYNYDMEYYTVADIENYTIFTSRNDPPIHHLSSMLLGAIPKTNKDEGIVNATFEFEITTSCLVEVQKAHPTYYNLSKQVISGEMVSWTDGTVAAGANPGGYSDTTIFSNKWQTNETDVFLRDNKYWSMSYGKAGKPTFLDYPNLNLL